MKIKIITKILSALVIVSFATLNGGIAAVPASAITTEPDSNITQSTTSKYKLDYPENFTINNDLKVGIYKYPSGYITDLRIGEKKIKTTGKTYYVSPNGLDNRKELSSTTPVLKDINQAILSNDVNTIVLLEGDYFR
jgi:hypothetical protein